MTRAELRRCSDGQFVAPIFDGGRLVAVLAGPADCVLGALPDFNVQAEDVEGLTEELRTLWGVRRERLVAS